MANLKIFVFLFVVMVSSSIILAQESPETLSSEPGSPQNAPTTQAPFGSGIFNHFPLKPPSFDLHALWPHFAATGFAPRHKRAIKEDSEIEDHPRAKRRVITYARVAIVFDVVIHFTWARSRRAAATLLIARMGYAHQSKDLCALRHHQHLHLPLLRLQPQVQTRLAADNKKPEVRVIL
ncbi:unnamed protein product [Arctia plantaginis]|uniref:Uncharacterized protein n=1 Tax=Arctia plantaginis TaxID=874455 RepID=A0A8S1AT40_ARCPL|nr:unnamed protein product [Arctia plantaginis]